MIDRIRLPGISDDTNDLVHHLREKIDIKAPRNIMRAAFYDGRRRVSQVGTVIPPQYYRLAIVLGWSAKAVDILTRRCNLEQFVWPDGNPDDLGMADIWRSNRLDSEINSAITSSLIHAVSFLITTEGGPGEPEALVQVKDAMSASGEWNHRTRSLSSALSINGNDDDGEPNSLALYLPNVTVVGRRDGRSWDVDLHEHPWGMPVEPLVYRPRVGREFGSSRISRPVMSLHEQALRTVIRLEGHMDVYSFPELIMLGADESIFKNPDGSMKSQWQVMLGRIKGIPDDDEAPESLARADVKQFAASDPEPHLKALKQQAQLFSGETSIPLTSLGVSDMTNPTSADSYIASREDLIAEAEGATDDWAPALRNTILKALMIANGERSTPDKWQSIFPQWRSPVYLSRAAQADAGLKQLTSVPWLADTEVGLELLGLTPQQIRRAMGDRRRAQGADLVRRLAGPDPAADPVAELTGETDADQG